MDWQLFDIVKTITNNILPSNLSAYTVGIRRYSHSVDRRFHSVDRQKSVISVHFHIALFQLICIGLYTVVLEIIKPISEKIDSTALTTWGMF